jgi:hypothetical protein
MITHLGDINIEWLFDDCLILLSTSNLGLFNLKVDLAAEFNDWNRCVFDIVDGPHPVILNFIVKFS